MPQRLLLHFVGVCFLLIGCSSANETLRKQEEDSSKAKIEYSIIYMIHGDSNYLFHEKGEKYQADDEVVKEAISAARKATNGEVFIFHQKPERKAGLFFPKKDRVLYHFRNGRLISETKYSPKGGGFKKEEALLGDKASSTSKRTFLAYFGHEIPLKEGQGYHNSQKNEPFNIPVFINGLKEIDRNFDMIALSVCNGGNPYLINELSGITNAVVASPQNLHLSHLSTTTFNLLEEHPNISSVDLADSIATESFRNLASFVETEITVATYSMKEVKKYSSSLSRLYEREISKTSEEDLQGDNQDCKNIQNYTSVFRNNGIKAYYISSSFGRNSSKKEHSGWGCKK